MLSYFGESAKFTLEPLVAQSAATHSFCDDIEGIDRIVLEEVTRYFGGAFGYKRQETGKGPLWVPWKGLARDFTRRRGSPRRHSGSSLPAEAPQAAV